MGKPTYTTIPQRSDGRGYIDCEVHRATSWAVRKSEKRKGGTRGTSMNKYIEVSAIVSRHDTRAQADLDRDYHTRSYEKPSRAYKLGQRMGVRI